MTEYEEIRRELGVPRYAPVIKPMPIPESGAFDAPLFCLSVNDAWVSYIVGMLDALDQEDAWKGTAEEVFSVRQNVLAIKAAFTQCTEEPVAEFRVEDCDLQWRENVDDEWTSLGNVCGADGADGLPGADGRDGNDGADGAPGTIGPTGETGPIGPKGDCCGIDDNDPPTDDTNDNLCGIATYLVTWNNDEWVDIIQRVKAAGDAATAIADVLAAVAGVGILTGSMVAVIQGFKAAGDTILDGYLAAIDTGTLETLQCSLYCDLKAAGSWSYATFAAWVSDQYDAAGIGNPALQALLNNFLQFTEAEIDKRALVGSLQPSTDCGALCTDCPTSGCTPELWTLFDDWIGIGQTVTYGSNYVEVTAVQPGGGGSYYIILKTDNIADCCQLQTHEIVENHGDFQNMGYTLCNSEVSEYVPGALGDPSITGVCINHLYCTMSGPSKVRFVFAAC